MRRWPHKNQIEYTTGEGKQRRWRCDTSGDCESIPFAFHHIPRNSKGEINEVDGILRSANAGHASIQSALSETRDCQSGFNLLNFLESGFHGYSGSGDIALHVTEQIA